jgi:hypothetical protein
LHAPFPIVSGNLGIAFNNIPIDISFPEMIYHRLATFGFGLENSIRNRFALGRERAGLHVVVDDIEKTSVITPVNRAMTPVEHHVVCKGKITIHPHTGIAPGIAGPEVVVKGAVQSADRAASCVMKGIQCFAWDLADSALLTRG